MFTVNQVERFFKIIEFYHLKFIIEHIGGEVLSSIDKEVLKKAGVDISLYKGKGEIEKMYKLGILSGILGNDNSKKIDFKDFTQYLEENPVALNIEEANALFLLQQRGYNDLKKSVNRIQEALSSINLGYAEKNRGIIENQIITLAEKNLIERKALSSMISDLGNESELWFKDLGKISDYIMHTAFEEGRANAFNQEKEDKVIKDGEILVYKDVYPGACRHCIQAYKTGDIDSEPIIFKLSDLEANGTNIGKKVVDWKPTLGCLHPFCRCTLNFVPKGYDWDPLTRDFTKVQPWVRKVERKSKIKLKVGSKKFEI